MGKNLRCRPTPRKPAPCYQQERGRQEPGPRPMARPGSATSGRREWRSPRQQLREWGRGRKEPLAHGQPRATGGPPPHRRPLLFSTEIGTDPSAAPAASRLGSARLRGDPATGRPAPERQPAAGAGRSPVGAAPAYLFSAWGSSRAGERRPSPRSAGCCCARAL